MKLEIIPINSVDEIEKRKIDEFILDDNTNGEFINTIAYLSYHPEDRFFDESIVVMDMDSGVIKSVMMAASDNSKETILSHPGTTFSGLIVSRKSKISEINEILHLIENYYCKKYKRIILKMPPSIYSSQPNEELYYTFMKNNYSYGYTGLSNIIDLSMIDNEDKLWKNYTSKKRNQVRKPFKKNEFSFIEVDKIDELVWFGMNENLRDKFNSKTTHTFSEICDLKARYPKNIVPFMVKNNKDEYGAFGLIYKLKNVFHTQYLDMNYNLSSEYPNLFLVHNLIKEAIKDKYRYFSFGASTENGGEYLNESLFAYKDGYGGGSILLPKFTKSFE